MKKHLAATKIQKIVRGKQLRQHLIEIDEVISKLKTDGTPEEHANNISYQLLKSLKNERLDLSAFSQSDEILRKYSLFCLY